MRIIHRFIFDEELFYAYAFMYELILVWTLFHKHIQTVWSQVLTTYEVFTIKTHKMCVLNLIYVLIMYMQIRKRGSLIHKLKKVIDIEYCSPSFIHVYSVCLSLN